MVLVKVDQSFHRASNLGPFKVGQWFQNTADETSALVPPTPEPGLLIAPILSLLTAPDAVAPELSLRIPADWQVPVTERWQVSTVVDFATTTLDQTVTHDQAIYDAQDLAVPGLAAALAAGVRYVRCGLATSGDTVWSNVVQVGTAAAPVFTSGSAVGGPEREVIAYPVTLAGPVAALYVAGGDAAVNQTGQLQYQITGFTPGGTSGTLEYAPGYVGDFDAIPVHEIIIEVIGLNGVIARQTVTNSLTDVDEVPDAPTWSAQTLAEVSTVYRRSVTIGGLAAGVSIPYSWTGTAAYKNGSGTSALSGTVQNGDVLDCDLLSPATYQTPASAVLSLIGSTTVTGTFNLSTRLDPSGVQPVLPTSGIPPISTGSATTRTYSGITFDQGGILVFAIHCLAGTVSGATIDGAAAVELASSGAGSSRTTKLYASATGLSPGTYSIGVTGTGMTSLGISPVMAVGAVPGATDTSIRDTSAGTIPHAFSDPLAVGASGLGLIAMTGAGLPTSWNNGAVQIIGQTGSSMGMALAVTGAGTTTPAFVHGSQYSDTSGAAIAVAHV